MLLGQRAVNRAVHVVVVAINDTRAGSGGTGDGAIGDGRQVIGLVGPAQRLWAIRVGPVHIRGAGTLEHDAGACACCPGGVGIFDVGRHQFDSLGDLTSAASVDSANAASTLEQLPCNRRAHRSGNPDYDVQWGAHQSFWISSSSPVISQRMSENGMPPAARNSSTKSRSTKSGPS